MEITNQEYIEYKALLKERNKLIAKFKKEGGNMKEDNFAEWVEDKANSFYKGIINYIVFLGGLTDLTGHSKRVDELKSRYYHLLCI